MHAITTQADQQPLIQNLEDAQKALEEAAGTMLDGRYIRCEPARVNRTIYLCHMPADTMKKVSRRWYSFKLQMSYQYKPILILSLGTSRTGGQLWASGRYYSGQIFVQATGNCKCVSSLQIPRRRCQGLSCKLTLQPHIPTNEYIWLNSHRFTGFV